MDYMKAVYPFFVEKLFDPVYSRWVSAAAERRYEQVIQALPVDSAYWTSSYGKFVTFIATPAVLILFSWCLTSDRTSYEAASYSYSAPESTSYSPSVSISPRPSNTSTTSAAISNCGFFDSFSDPSYRAFLSGLSDTALLAKEKSKMTATISSGAGLAGGAVSAIATGGLTLPLLALSGRNAYLAAQKLPLIREEMERRGLRKREYTPGMLAKAAGPSAFRTGVGLGTH